MASEFATNKNKGFLWDFLYKNGMFKNLTSVHEHRVKTIFEQEILSTKNTASNENITELNKAFITKIVKDIEALKTQSQSHKHPIVESNNKDNALKTSMRYTHQEAAAERQRLFQNNLQETQNNFNEHMKVAKPKAIDFADKDGDDADHNLDSKLAEIVERRKRDMNMVVSSYDTPPDPPADSISIGKETELATVQIVDIEPKKIKKSVSFDENTIAAALGKNMEELFTPPVETEELDAPNVFQQEEPYANDQLLETTDLTVNNFLSQLKTKPVVENSAASASTTHEQQEDTDKFQTILHEIADIHDTLRIILETVKQPNL